MICPTCSATCQADDGYCHQCHQPLPTGPRRVTVVRWCGGVGAGLAALFVFLVAPITSGKHVAGAACVAVPFMFAGTCVGSLAGWVVGRILCDH